MQENRKLIFKSILSIAFPAIITNITTPLLGMADVTIAGHMGSVFYVSAIAVGSNMFNLVYWLFGFLRMGSSGITAQKFGAGKIGDSFLILYRALTIGICSGILLIVLSYPLKIILLNVMDIEGQSRLLAVNYFNILIWGAPAVLGTFAITGWFLGMQDTKSPMIISIAVNIINIVLSVWCVFSLEMKIEGLAVGTLTAQWVGFLLGLTFIVRKYGKHAKTRFFAIFNRDIFSFFRINIYIFLRTLCLVTVTLWFTRAGAALGAEILAVNALILQLFTLFSYFIDGFAFSAEALCGKYKGARNKKGFHITCRILLEIAFTLSLIFSILYFIFGENLISFMCSDLTIKSLSNEYYIWAVTIPLAAFLAFTYDGIFIGVTEVRSLLWSLIGATIVFFGVYLLTAGTLFNHGLWLAFILYLLTRGLILKVLSRKFKKDSFFKSD